MFPSFNLIQPQLIVLTHSNDLCYVQSLNIPSVAMTFQFQTFLPQAIIPQNSFQLHVPQMLYPNQHEQKPSSIDSSFKFNFLEILANQFPKVLKDYVLQIIKSNFDPKFHFGKSTREIKRISKNLLLKFIQEHTQIFLNLLNEETCVNLVQKVYHQYVKVVNQKKVRIQNFIQLYFQVSSQFKTNCQLTLLKSEIMELFSKI
jgi:hypothetical protein